MFVYDFIQLDVPFEEVRRRLVDGERPWLAPLAAAAFHEGEATVVSLGLDGAQIPLDKQVAVDLDAPLDQEDFVAIPIRWRATGPAGLFPALDGHLEASRMGDSRTHLSLQGRYEPPGGHLGRLLNRMAFHHVAEASVRSFLHRVADALETDRQPARHLA
jgi:hypothetical protein